MRCQVHSSCGPQDAHQDPRDSTCEVGLGIRPDDIGAVDVQLEHVTSTSGPLTGGCLGFVGRWRFAAPLAKQRGNLANEAGEGTAECEYV
jgi:hypothetical protein